MMNQSRFACNRPTFGQLIVLKSSGGSVLRIIDFITSYDQCKCNDFAQILLGDYVRVRKHQNDSKGSKDMFVREVLRDWLSRDDDTVDRTVPRTWNDFADCLEKSGLDGVFVKAIRDIITLCSLVQSPHVCSSSFSTSPSMGPSRTIVQLPQRMRILGPASCFATVKVASITEMTPQDSDQWHILPLSIVDSTSGAPLNCVVALQGDQHKFSQGVAVCFLSITVVQEEQSQVSTGQLAAPPAYYIERKSRYEANGRATFRVCFSAETSHLISINVHCIQDNEGVECVGYNVEQYAAVVTAVRIMGRNAFRSPSLLKFVGPLASKNFEKLFEKCANLTYRNDMHELHKMESAILSSERISHDIKMFLTIANSLVHATQNGVTHVQCEELLHTCESLDSRNAFLLEAYATVTLSQSYAMQGDTEKAMDCIHKCRSMCFEAEPSYLTSLVFFTEALNLIRAYDGNITPSVKTRVMQLFDYALAHSYSYRSSAWAKANDHIYKALFCLNGSMYFNFNPTPSYTPTEEDLSIAEQHLNAVPIEDMPMLIDIMGDYHVVLSDFHRLKGDTTTAIQHARQAQKLYAEIGMVGFGLDARVEYLESDPIHMILQANYEEFL